MTAYREHLLMMDEAIALAAVDAFTKSGFVAGSFASPPFRSRSSPPGVTT